MKLIALTGLPRSGKDTVAAWLIAHHGFTKMAFADPLKKAAAILLDRTEDEANGINFDREAIMPEWGFSMRWFLQRFGTECMRNQIDPDFWLKRMDLELLSWAGVQAAMAKIVITDCRFPNEAATVRNRGGKIVEIRRPGLVASDHVSDSMTFLEPDDYVIYNHGTLTELYGQADRLASVI